VAYRTSTCLVACVFLLGALLSVHLTEGADEASTATPTAAKRPALEVEDDPFIPVAPSERVTQPAKTWTRDGFTSVQVNVDGVGANIVGDAANEPSLAVDPNDPQKIVIGWRQFDTIASNFRQAGWAYSSDGGQIWTFPGVIEPGVFRSDPVLGFDNAGTFYYDSLTSDTDFHCHVFTSIDSGATWGTGVPAWGGDKQWMTVDRTGGPGEGHLYQHWTPISYPESFNRSLEGGQSI
jgi:hypothetical protein